MAPVRSGGRGSGSASLATSDGAGPAGGGGRGSQEEKVKEGRPSRWPRDGGHLDRLDKHITLALANIHLPVPLEALLSIPGCGFGLPPFMTTGPLVLALLAHPAPSPASGLALLLVLLAGTAITLATLSSSSITLARRVVFAPAFMAAYPRGGWVGGMLMVGGEAWRLGAMYIIAFFGAASVVLTLKHFTARRRPASLPHLPLRPRHFTTIGTLLRLDSNASFPSGDMASVVAFAVPLALGLEPGLGDRWDAAAAACVCLAAYGRMYFHAHHALDVLVGGGVSLAISLGVWTALEGGAAVQIWHPIAAQIFMGAVVLTFKRKTVGKMQAY